jgi:hypothetical protein
MKKCGLIKVLWYSRIIYLCLFLKLILSDLRSLGCLRFELRSVLMFRSVIYTDTEVASGIVIAKDKVIKVGDW